MKGSKMTPNGIKSNEQKRIDVKVSYPIGINVEKLRTISGSKCKGK